MKDYFILYGLILFIYTGMWKSVLYMMIGIKLPSLTVSILYYYYDTYITYLS